MRKYGFPDWEMVRWFESNGEIVAQIPVFFDKGTETQAVILAVEYNNKLKFRLFVRDKFEKYAMNKKPVPTAEIIKDLFMLFDFHKFGESSYLTKGYFVSSYEETVNLKSTSGYFYEDCFYVATYYDGEMIRLYEDCVTYYIWGDEMTDPDDPGGGDSGDWYDPSTGDVPVTCDLGYTLDKDGNCVKIPCDKNPIFNLEVAAQKVSGIEGGMFGCTRKDADEICGGVKGQKEHDGIDLKNDYGNPIFAMYDGIFYNSRYHDKAGWYVRIQSTINGETIITEYMHLQEENRIELNPNETYTYIKAGDIIGYQGDSGNLAEAIADGKTVSHVHIKIKLHDGSKIWDYSKNFTSVDPRDYFSTIINDDGSVVSNTNCN